MKSHLKKLLILVLAMVMVCSMVACSNGPNESKSPEDSENVETSEPVPGGSDHSETVDLTMVLVTDGTEYPGDDAVDEAVAKIAKDELNVNLSFKRANFFDYGTSMNLWLSSGEPCDLFVSLLNWNSYKQYMTDLVPYMELMPDALEIVGGYIDMAYVGEKLLGVPAMKDMTNFVSYIMRKDYVEETGIDVSTIKTYDGFEQLLRAVKENHPDLYPLVNSDLSYGGGLLVNNINAREDGTLFATDDLVSDIGVGLLDPINSTEVSCIYASDFYRETCERAYKWNKEGLLYCSDISTGSEQVRAGTGVGYYTQYKPGVERQESTAAGTEMMLVFGPDASSAVKKTNNFFTWSVNQNCENPDRAVDLLNLLYTNEKINNALAWGIEGTDYVHVEGTDNVVKYPEGVDPSNPPYSFWAKFSLPNNYLQYVMEDQDPEYWTKMREFNEGAQTSLAFGFAFDSSSVVGETTSVVNVINEYNRALLSGTMNPDEKLDDFLADLDTAGMQTIIDTVQTDLDAWLAAKG